MSLTRPTRPSPARSIGEAPHSNLTRKLIEEGLKRRTDDHGPLRFMAKSEGYVMVRRPGCAPFVIRESVWLSLPATERAA